jgi:hypothetical protein
MLSSCATASRTRNRAKQRHGKSPTLKGAKPDPENQKKLKGTDGTKT